MEDYSNLYKRLTVIEGWGVKLKIGGRTSTADKIINQMVREEGSYMPDLVYNDAGNLIEVNYDRVE